MIYPFRGVTPKIHKTAFVVPSADIIGDVHIGENASVWFNVVIRGDVNSIRIGAGSNIQDGSILHVTHKTAALDVRNNVTVGHSVTLHGCTVHDFCLIGMRAVIMDHAEIGEESIVGAGALVTQGTKIPPRSMVLGSPAKVIRTLKPEEISFLHQSPENYKQYVRWFREGDFPEIGPYKEK
ncbi:MAG: gamma carbonic anhydrase family protein [Bacteriovoracia bacterium]